MLIVGRDLERRERVCVYGPLGDTGPVRRLEPTRGNVLDHRGRSAHKEMGPATGEPSMRLVSDISPVHDERYQDEPAGKASSSPARQGASSCVLARGRCRRCRQIEGRLLSSCRLDIRRAHRFRRRAARLLGALNRLIVRERSSRIGSFAKGKLWLVRGDPESGVDAVNDVGEMGFVRHKV